MLYGMGFFIGDNYDYELRTLCMEQLQEIRKDILYSAEMLIHKG